MNLDQKNKILLEGKGISKSFRRNDHQDHVIFDNLNLTLHEHEIVVLLGKSGSGKSTLLRIIAGLIQPTQGEVLYRSQLASGPLQSLSMVFQSFALLPWLTVLQNVELGLEAQGIPKAERRRRALEAIDIIGMDGFESAYPKELSGGMCQRVGFARALVVNPEILLMDEAFSALDVLTADNLRSDLLDLWQCDKTNIKTILLVTHNIEEAAFLADRILILGTNPGGIKAELSVEMPHPRNTKSSEFHNLVDEIYMLLTEPRNKSSGVLKPRIIDFTHHLPKVEISELTGLLETLISPEYPEKIELAHLSEELLLGIDDLFPLTEALEILRFATISDGDIQLTEIGKQFAEADILQRKKIFAGQLLNFVPLARHVRQVLDERPRHKASEDRFLEELEDHLSVEAAEEVLQVVIDWGRYAELFAYDYNKGILSLEDPT